MVQTNNLFYTCVAGPADIMTRSLFFAAKESVLSLYLAKLLTLIVHHISCSFLLSPRSARSQNPLLPLFIFQRNLGFP